MTFVVFNTISARSLTQPIAIEPNMSQRTIRCGVDEGRNSWNLPAITLKARTAVGRGEKSLLSDPGSELRLGREKARIIEGTSKTNTNKKCLSVMKKTSTGLVPKNETVTETHLDGGEDEA